MCIHISSLLKGGDYEYMTDIFSETVPVFRSAVESNVPIFV